MHERSLAQGMIRQVLALAQKHQAGRITSITVLLGPFSGVVAESFAFGFEVLKKEEPCLAGAVLHLEQPDPHYHCLECGMETSLPIVSPFRHAMRAQMDYDRVTSRCPACGSSLLSPLGGTELILQQIRME